MAGLFKVFLQVSLLFESTATLLAFEGTLASVSAEVYLKVGFPLLGELLTTDGAGKDLLHDHIAILHPG